MFAYKANVNAQSASLAASKGEQLRKPALIVGILAVLAATPVHATHRAPYPKSTFITGITWETETWRSSAPGGDIWPVTWAQDNTLRTAWGDGEVGCSAEGQPTGSPRSPRPRPAPPCRRSAAALGRPGKGKIMTLLAAGSNLYAVMAMEGAGVGYPVWRSTDGGRLWQKPSWSFPSLVEAFVQFGRANAGAPGGYAYLLDARETEIHLMRVPAGNAQTQSAYEYFSGSTDGRGLERGCRPVQADLRRPEGHPAAHVTYNPGLRRYLMTVAHATVGIPSSHKQGVFEAPNLWGPWRAVFYETANFLGMRGGWYLGMHFPVKWQSADGRTLWAVFSCHDNVDPGSCGQYHDRFNLMRARLTVAAR